MKRRYTKTQLAEINARKDEIGTILATIHELQKEEGNTIHKMIFDKLAYRSYGNNGIKALTYIDDIKLGLDFNIQLDTLLETIAGRK